MSLPGFFLLKQVFLKVADIYRDHVSEPLHSIYQELVKGRLDVTDRKARSDAIESLKRMIYSWLDEYFPKMSIEEKEMRAESMDISLIEKNMEGEFDCGSWFLKLFVTYKTNKMFHSERVD